MNDLWLHGILPAIITPFTSEGSVDEPGLVNYLSWLKSQGVHAVVVHADSGEGHTLTPEERAIITSLAAEVMAGEIPVIGGLIAQSTAEAVELGRMDRDAGADALMVFPPISFLGTPLPPEMAEGYFGALADQVGLPLVAFQLQTALGGVEYTTDVLERILAIEAVVAIKEASFDALKFQSVLKFVQKLPRKISVLSGNDNFIYESLILGADGCLIGFGTLASRIQVDMYDAVVRRDYEKGEVLAARLEPLIDAVFQAPIRNYRGRMKEALVLQGVIGTSIVRPPLMSISDEEKLSIRRGLESAEILAPS